MLVPAALMSPAVKVSAADPTITGITPSSGLQGGEYDVTITGTGFTDAVEETDAVWLEWDED
ncbi:MAG: hypothetical protein FJ008_09550, partial [Chloroflexi bacterium]|nr:hypothetical protein [Chloroflexota bacterium]